jgi:GntR family transcriptional regulator, transcriptional repressor for pyruvate dehydrogenase complex
MADTTAPSLTFQPVTRSKLAETVAQQLLSEIRDKELPPETRIPSERELMASFGVGRSTVREAVNGLAMLGVLEIRHGQGAFVADPAAGASAPSVIEAALARGFTRDLFEARMLVEVAAARLAAERRTDAEVAEIEQTLIDHERALADGSSGVEAAVQFHMRIGDAAHSDVLAGFVHSLAEVMRQRGPTLEAEPGYREWEVEQHRSVFEPIRDGDPVLAAERMRAHLDAVLPHHEQIGLE